MDESLLLLRLALAALIAGHACQKLFGWFRGRGIRGTAPLFEASGLRPGAVLVAFAGITELAGAGLLALGLLTPLASTMILGTMIVAGATTAPKGLWAHLGGFEVPLAYSLIAVAIVLSGPGSYSVDAALGLDAVSGPVAALAAVALAAAGASPFLLLIRRAQLAQSATVG